ncbi:MAG: magnesium transporter [Candidatus Poribacteria bacterium]|nr:magnesium transporter [Candidatus Poribacteria bacterium]
MINTRDRDEILISTVIKLIKRKAIPNLKNMIAKTHSADIARWFPHLRPEEQTLLFDLLIKEERMGEALSEMNSEDRNFFIETTEPAALADVLHSMPADDVSDILADLPDEQQEELLKLIKGKASEDLEQLLQYEEKTAGYIMTPNFFAVPEETTAAAATEQIRELVDVEMVFYVYVIDEENRLKGVISLRQLVATRPNTPLKDLMTTRVYAVYTHTLQEEVARVVARYNLLAVPVLDDADHLAGIVTIDDVVDVIREENTEDMLKMAGTGDVDIASRSVVRNTRARLPWLLASFAGGLVAVYVIGIFEGQLTQLAPLAAFIPIIMGMGGNIGTQSSTIIVRGLAIGEVDLTEVWKVLWREFATGAALGGIYGILLGAFGKLRFWTVEVGGQQFVWKFPLVVALSICINMILAATVGTIVPMFFQRIRVDPAIATGPFVTTAIDILGILSYFMIAKSLLF